MTPPDEHTSFDDPTLKQLCCHAWRKDCASKELHAKLAAALFDESAGDTIRPPVAFWQRPFVGVAAAAVVLIVSGVAILQYHSSNGNVVATAVDAQLAADLVSRHDSCCNGHGNHQLPGIALNDMNKLGQALSTNLHRPVLVSAMPEMGWSLRGGEVCPVGKTPSAHVIFDHGGESVSVFSLPRTPDEHDGRYQMTLNNHAIAGFVDSRGTFFLVGSGEPAITPEHLAALRDQMQSNVVMNADYAPRESFAELLH